MQCCFNVEKHAGIILNSSTRTHSGDQARMSTSVIPCPELSTKLPGDNFIRLEFNLVLVVLIAIHVTSCKFLNLGWLIDLIAGVLLCYGTYCRKRILSSPDWSLSRNAAVNAEGQVVENYLVLSLLTWIASTLFEIKSFTYLFKIGLGSYKMWKLSKKDFVFLLLSVLASANASWVMLQFTSEVHQSFECITRDKLLLIYFCMAAFAKNIRVFMQGLVFSSRIAAHSWEFLPKDNKKREMMARMAFSNFITLRVLIWVYYHIGDPWTPKLLLTFLSVFIYLLYHLVIIAWFVHNSSLKQMLLTITNPSVCNAFLMQYLYQSLIDGASYIVDGMKQAYRWFIFIVLQDNNRVNNPPPTINEFEEEGHRTLISTENNDNGVNDPPIAAAVEEEGNRTLISTENSDNRFNDPLIAAAVEEEGNRMDENSELVVLPSARKQTFPVFLYYACSLLDETPKNETQCICKPFIQTCNDEEIIIRDSDEVTARDSRSGSEDEGINDSMESIEDRDSINHYVIFPIPHEAKNPSWDADNEQLVGSLVHNRDIVF